MAEAALANEAGERSVPAPAEIDAYLKLGLRNRLHPVLPSHFVADKPVGIARLTYTVQYAVFFDRVEQPA